MTDSVDSYHPMNLITIHIRTHPNKYTQEIYIHTLSGRTAVYKISCNKFIMYYMLNE